MEIDTSKLGEAIRQIREARGMTQIALAEQIGRTSNYVAMLERGERAPRFDTLNSIAEVLKVPAATLTCMASVPIKDAGLDERITQLRKLIIQIVKYEKQSRNNANE